MRKIMCLLFCFIIIVSMAISASANTVLNPVPVEKPNFGESYKSFMPKGIPDDFNIQAGNSKILLNDYYVTEGSTKITIRSCTWNPADCDVTIGYYPQRATHGPYGVTYKGGSIYNRTINSNGVPSGMYFIYYK